MNWQTYESTSAITMSAISNAISTGLNPLRVTIPMTGVKWADKYFYLPEAPAHRWPLDDSAGPGSDAQYDD